MIFLSDFSFNFGALKGERVKRFRYEKQPFLASKQRRKSRLREFKTLICKERANLPN